MSIGSLCNPEVVVAERDTTLAEAAKLMRNQHVGNVVVVDDAYRRRPVGLVTDRDIVIAAVAMELDPATVNVAEIMREPLEAASHDTDFWEALNLMRKRGVRRLPVVDNDGSLAGILTLDDALALVGEAVSNLVALVSREIDREPMFRPETPDA